MGLFDRLKRAFTGGEVASPEAPLQDEKKIELKAYDQGMEKTRQSFSSKINALMADFRAVDEEFFEELEECFISADVGFDMTLAITDAVRERVKLSNAKRKEDVKRVIVETLVDIYEGQETHSEAMTMNANGPSVFLFVGVNGVGKTTTIGKLAHYYQQQGKSVILAAADTFRAGAIEQLEEWGHRAKVPVVSGKAGGDPASVVYDALDKAEKEGIDIVLVDTAGRLQTKVNLMKELEKINRIIERKTQGPAQEVLLVLDATTGQNALIQAKQFQESVPITGMILTKLDGTAKGGVVLAIRQDMDIPVKFIGLGEGINDLKVFDAEYYMMGLLKDLL